jgi:acyl-CoA thioesterase FadM
MNLYLRLALAICAGMLRERLDHRDSLSTWHRVWLHDLDAFGHMNNGRYLQIMDVARAAWMARVGVLSCMWQERWSAVLGGGCIRFRHSLKPFQRYRVRTRLVSWDERWWFLEHTFFDDSGRQIATGISRAALRSRAVWVPTRAVVERVRPGAVAPPLPDYVRRWLDAEQAMWHHSAPDSGAEQVQPAATRGVCMEEARG